MSCNEWERRHRENPLAPGQVWDGNDDGAECGPALFVIYNILPDGRVRYGAPVGRRLDGYTATATVPEEELKRYLWRLLTAQEVERLGGKPTPAVKEKEA